MHLLKTVLAALFVTKAVTKTAAAATKSAAAATDSEFAHVIDGVVCIQYHGSPLAVSTFHEALRASILKSQNLHLTTG